MREVRIMITGLCCMLFILSYNPERSSAEILLQEGKENYPIGSVIELLEDMEGKWDIGDIASGKLDDHFFQYPGDVPSYGYTESTFWARITVTNDSPNEDWLLDMAYPPHDWIGLYIPAGGNGYELRETGDHLPFSARDIYHRNFVYRLTIPQGETVTYYLQVDTAGSMQLPMTLWSEDDFYRHSLVEYILLGIYFGFGLIMILYNLFLFISLRFTSYLWYVLFILSIMLCHFTLNGLAFQYFWPEMMWWNNRAILFFIASANISAMLFTKSFLHLKTNTPRLHTLINLFIITQPVFIIILAISYEDALNLIMGSTISLVLIVNTAAILSWKNGYDPAKYFFFGWVIFLMGVTCSSLADMGFIPVTFITKYASQLGSGIEIVLFSLALTEKIKRLRREKEAAEQHALKSQELAVKHLQKANKIKDEFLANTSHELRTPLHGMIGIAESLQENPGIDERMNKNLSLIVTSGKRLTHLINDLLDASKLNHHELDLEIEPVSLRELAEVICTVSSTIHSEKPVAIRNRIPSTLPAAAADENRLQQIMYNLVGNAIKYTDSGEITVSAVEEEEEIILSVEDTGIGISEQNLRIIFDSFERGTTRQNRFTTGTGLGLSITKQLIELHGGDITIQSTVGKGTTVSFSVPIYRGKKLLSKPIISNPSSHDQQQAAIQEEMAAESIAENQKQRILIADDEPVNIQVLQNHLSTAGYQIVVAYNGESVLNHLAENAAFDLVILDIMLPKQSGFEIAKKLRAQYSLTELPILMLTARSQTDDIVTAFEMGANDYLTKPCSKEELLSRVKTLLSLKQVMEEVVSINMELSHLNHSLETQVIKRTQELEVSTEQLRRTESSRKQLMSNISHELGTPMTSVKGYVKAMIDGVVDARDHNYLKIVYQKILFIDRLIQDLYELSRLESGQLSFQWKQQAAGDLPAILLQKYEIDVKSHGLVFEIQDELEESDRMGLVTIDFDRIDQVMQNLIFNAIRFTSEPGLIKITLKKTNSIPVQQNEAGASLEDPSDTSFLQVSVRDTGEGMDPETIPLIFDRFYQADKTSKEKGTNTGLGLSISKQIMEYHHGCLWAESNLGKGSTFHFILPLLYTQSVQRGEQT
ncbi:ATP-binding protein [Oceanobacillus damuensis]|uniref:ATP-binding protein n=1 Tax=Oceanobacillus damuensis TaxID=937928 RepID=UPI0008307A0E|nr:ATP-binding protein [Oceanobacillus damuensis]